MKPEIQELFCAALESDQYKQGFEDLRVGDCFCALGVLTDLYIRLNGGEWAIADHDPVCAFEGCIGAPPVSVYMWSGLTVPQQESIVHLNDDCQMPFKEIAALIRAWSTADTLDDDCCDVKGD